MSEKLKMDFEYGYLFIFGVNCAFIVWERLMKIASTKLKKELRLNFKCLRQLYVSLFQSTI